MNHVIPISEARSKLPKLVELADSIARRTFITVKGKVKAVLISPEELEGMEETIDILSNPKTLESIKKGLEDYKHGRTIPFDKLRKELDL